MASAYGKQVYQLQDALYYPAAKIVLEKGGLFVSNEDGRTKMVLKLRNVGEETLTALQLAVRCMDAFGGDLGEFQQQYIDLDAECGQSFGTDMPADVPQGNTRSISMKITAVVFANGQTWRQEGGEAGIALPKAKPLPYGPEALEEFRTRMGCKMASDMPLTAEGLWRCTCGSWNAENAQRCGACRLGYVALRQMPSEEALLNAIANRKQEARRAEEEARHQAEQKRIAAEAEELAERQEAARQAQMTEKKRKKKRRRIVIWVILAVLFVALALGLPLLRQIAGALLLEAEKPELAYKVVTFMEGYDYPDSSGYIRNSEWVRGKVFVALAEKELAAGNIDEAKKYYEMVHLRDSGNYEQGQAKMAKEYFAAVDAQEAGDRKTALTSFLNCKGFHDATVRCAELYILDGEYLTAANQLFNMTEHADAYAALREKYPQLDYVHRVLDNEPITFGAYTGNDKVEPIEWVKVPGSYPSKSVYMVSVKNLFNRVWHNNSKVSTWAKSDLRKYLNETFLANSFDEYERQAIFPMAYDMGVSNYTKKAIGWEWPVEKASTDHVTILSAAEASTYYVNHRNETTAAKNEEQLVTRESNPTYFWSRNITNKAGNAGVLPLKWISSKTVNFAWAPVDSAMGVRPAITVDIDMLADMYVNAQKGNALTAEGKHAEAAEVLKEAGVLGREAALYSNAMLKLDEVRSSDADLETRINMYESAGRLLTQIPGYMNTDAEVQRATYEFGLLCAEAGQTKDAIEALTQAGEYLDAQQQIVGIIQAEANRLCAAGDFLGANEWLAKLPAEQVQGQVNDNLCAEAENLVAQGKYLEAQRMLKKMTGYARADELLAQTPAFAMLDAINSMETLTLGSFDQDGVAENGREPIEWIVMKKDTEKEGWLELLSRNSLTSRGWDDNEKAANWGASSLYSWLNGEFLRETFNVKEKRLLRDVSIRSKAKKDYHQDTGTVRLMTLDEAAVYFDTVDASKAAYSAAATAATREAEKSYNINIDKEYWWLCDVQSSGALVMPFNTREGYTYNYMMVTPGAVLGVRPMIAVDMNKLVDVLLLEQEAAAQMAAGEYLAFANRTDLTSAMQPQQRYAKAMSLRQQIETADAKALLGLYKQYTDMLRQAGSYAEAAQLYAEGCYQYAGLLAESGDYRAAGIQYAQAGEYKDAPQMLESIRVRQAVQDIHDRAYAEAYSLLTSLTDNAEAQQLLQEEPHLTAYAQLLHEMKKGSTYSFGRYEQDSSKSNGAEAILWRILDQTEDGRVLLLSDQILTHRAFHSKKTITWNDSNIRTWLNGEFAEEVFSKNEYNALVEVSVDNAMPGTATWGTETKPVENRVFLLSLGEAMTYFDTVEESCTTSTLSAKNTYPYTQTTSIDDWLTRSTDTGKSVVALLPFTTLSKDKNSANFSTCSPKDSYGIRPAVWVSIEKMVSISTAAADGIALKENGAYAEALKVLALSDAPEATASMLETYFLMGGQSMAAGEYEAACGYFEQAGDYTGAADALHQARYTLAAAQEAEGKYTEAIANYSLADDWQDAAERIGACYYKHGMELLEKKAFDASVDAFTQAGDTENAKDMILRAHYEKAEKLEGESDYAGALEKFIQADGWKDAADRQKECRYLLAQTMLSNKQYVSAQEQLALLSGYKDADALSQQYLEATHVERTRTQWSVGNRVQFGRTEQDGKLDNGAEPIEWRVLDVEGDRVLLLSEKILAYRAFDDSGSLWGASDLRQWLNSTFFTSSFTAREMDCLLRLTQYNGKNSKINATLLNEDDTEDWVFLLSLSEASHYMDSIEASETSSTDYAWAQNKDSQRNKYRNNWWLRVARTNSPARHAVILPFTKYVGSEWSASTTDMKIGALGVRPAIWVDVTKIIDMTR